jgi:peptidoglycan/xylan/chitin deacetylase (PgdA/CDA1 family)
LSFDDGWKSIYDNAFPLLQKARVKSTHYIVSGYLDAMQFPHYVNIEHIVDLQQAGHEIGCHTVSHRHLPQEPDALIRDEIVLSKTYLERLSVHVATFAYPYGEYDKRVVATVKDAGFECARSTIRGFNDTQTERFLLKVQAVKSSTNFDEITAWINRALEDGTWLILMFHQIDYGGREWSTTPEMLASILDYLNGKNAKTVTVSEGIKMLTTIVDESTALND